MANIEGAGNSSIYAGDGTDAYPSAPVQSTFGGISPSARSQNTYTPPQDAPLVESPLPDGMAAAGVNSPNPANVAQYKGFNPDDPVDDDDDTAAQAELDRQLGGMPARAPSIDAMSMPTPGNQSIVPPSGGGMGTGAGSSITGNTKSGAIDTGQNFINKDAMTTQAGDPDTIKAMQFLNSDPSGNGWQKAISALGAIADAYGSGKRAFAGVNSPTRLQQQFQMKLQSQQKANEAAAEARSRLQQINAETNGALMQIIKSGDVGRYNQIIETYKDLPAELEKLRMGTIYGYMSNQGAKNWLSPEAVANQMVTNAGQSGTGTPQ